MNAQVEATLVECADAAPGAFEYVCRMDCTTPVGLAYKCPCGCGYEGHLPFHPHVKNGGAAWQCDGNEESPTLTPSIHHVQDLSKGGDKTHWHGWLRDGVWQAC